VSFPNRPGEIEEGEEEKTLIEEVKQQKTRFGFKRRVVKYQHKNDLKETKKVIKEGRQEHFP